MKTKFLYIDPDYSIRDIQEIFSQWYPYLRINFFVRRPDDLLSSNENVAFIDSVRLHAMNATLQVGTIEIDDDTTIQDFEKEFLQKFGLKIEVNRRSGNLWLDTDTTNKWTLKEQNDHGEEITEYQKLPVFGQLLI
jgi:hypothetical protein